jgi:hypothetical protein
MWKTEHLWRFSEGETKQCSLDVAKWQILIAVARRYLPPPLPAPIKLCPAPVSLVFLHMFCIPAWFYIFCYCAKKLATFFKIKFVLIFFCFALLRGSAHTKSEPPRCMVVTTGIDFGAEKSWQRFRRWEERAFFSIAINFHSQKVKPCGRTTRFSAGLHSQAQKGRRTILDGAGGLGGGI